MSSPDCPGVILAVFVLVLAVVLAVVIDVLAVVDVVLPPLVRVVVRRPPPCHAYGP